MLGGEGPDQLLVGDGEPQGAAAPGCAPHIGAAQTAGPATQQVETWRMFGFLMFAGVFVLLGLWPRRLPGQWELTIANKVGLTVAEALLIGNHAAGAQFAATADGILSVLLIAAYLLSRGYTTWRPLPKLYAP